MVKCISLLMLLCLCSCSKQPEKSKLSEAEYREQEQQDFVKSNRGRFVLLAAKHEITEFVATDIVSTYEKKHGWMSESEAPDNGLDVTLKQLSNVHNIPIKTVASVLVDYKATYRNE